MNGKGSKPRPFSVSQEEFKKNWDEIFAKKVSVQIKTLDNGDEFIELPEALMEGLDWKVGDEIVWTEQSDGTFKLTKKSEYFYGRGVTDMKGGIACFLKALKMLVISNEINGKHIRIILTGDEEVGSDRGTKALISKGLIKGSAAICGEPTNLNIYNGSRGLIWGQVEIFGKSGHAGFGTDFFNPIEKLAEVINEFSKFDLNMTHKEFPNSNSKINITTQSKHLF